MQRKPQRSVSFQMLGSTSACGQLQLPVWSQVERKAMKEVATVTGQAVRSASRSEALSRRGWMGRQTGLVRASEMPDVQTSASSPGTDSFQLGSVLGHAGARESRFAHTLL